MNRYARRLRREARLLGSARMAGRLYRVSWYPGLRPPRSPLDFVTGELYRLRQPLKTLEVLDRYEEPHRYRRELRSATLGDGRSLKAWVYMFRQPRPEDCRVASGEW